MTVLAGCIREDKLKQAAKPLLQCWHAGMLCSCASFCPLLCNFGKIDNAAYGMSHMDYLFLIEGVRVMMQRYLFESLISNDQFAAARQKCITTSSVCRNCVLAYYAPTSQ